MQTFVSAVVIARPPGSRLAPTRAVAARHRDRAALHGSCARPRLLVVGFDRRSRRLPAELAPDHVGHLGESLEVVPADERVAVRQRGEHAAGPNREVTRADPRIHPHDPMGQARKALHLAADEYWVSTLPAV